MARGGHGRRAGSTSSVGSRGSGSVTCLAWGARAQPSAGGAAAAASHCNSLPRGLGHTPRRLWCIAQTASGRLWLVATEPWGGRGLYNIFAAHTGRSPRSLGFYAFTVVCSVALHLFEHGYPWHSQTRTRTPLTKAHAGCSAGAVGGGRG
eukprot:1643876-Prymnesium_polylepis.1